MEFLDVVNNDDKVIGRAPRSQVYANLLTHRIAHVILFNKTGKMCLQMRGNVSFCPFHWDFTASGHVRSGETYEEAAFRELDEEVGVKTKIKFEYKDLYTYTGNERNGLKKFLATFSGVYEGKFKLDKNEVEKVGFFSLEEIRDMMDKGEKFHPELSFILRKHFGVN